jgi:hypothetical protein
MDIEKLGVAPHTAAPETAEPEAIWADSKGAL